MIINHILMVIGGSKVGTLPPCWDLLTWVGTWELRPHANRPWGPLYTRDWEPVTITLQVLSLVEKVELVQVRFTLRFRDQQSLWMQDGCKVYMDSYMASNGSCFMITRIIFQNHLLEIDLTQNRATMALRILQRFIYSILPCVRTHMNRDSLK